MYASQKEKIFGFVRNSPAYWLLKNREGCILGGIAWSLYSH